MKYSMLVGGVLIAFCLGFLVSHYQQMPPSEPLESKATPEALTAKPIVDFKPIYQAARQGDAEAQFQMAMHQNGKTNDSAVLWFKRAARQGHVEAMYQLAGLYFEEYDKDKRARGKEWAIKADEAGHPLAALLLARKAPAKERLKWQEKAVLTEPAIGLELASNLSRDSETAKRRYQLVEQAAAYGYAMAQITMVPLAAYGDRIYRPSPNLQQLANRWLSLAAKQRHHEAQRRYVEFSVGIEDYPNAWIWGQVAREKLIVNDAEYKLSMAEFGSALEQLAPILERYQIPESNDDRY
ncbi:hypothetical protein L2750_12755 [Shewanella submarina]|uniref:Tetratricopeptide repeat protein n=1 Tax=Shewanella submarina TaxID=2016376 RepID=A0ABV7GDM5_9GAMM|nr:hypothetical protein [Shewanella submarina]MCL1038019.1 hypothetical protein [Shewanella submarina]